MSKCFSHICSSRLANTIFYEAWSGRNQRGPEWFIPLYGWGRTGIWRGLWAAGTANKSIIDPAIQLPVMNAKFEALNVKHMTFLCSLFRWSFLMNVCSRRTYWKIITQPTHLSLTQETTWLFLAKDTSKEEALLAHTNHQPTSYHEGHCNNTLSFLNKHEQI